jgi:hypothetical protein
LDPGIDRAMGKWTAAEDAKLIDAVSKYGKDWAAVAALVPGRANMQCRSRWLDSMDPGVERAMGKWTVEEDEKLADAVKKHGNNWVLAATLIPGYSVVEGAAPIWPSTPNGRWLNGQQKKMQSLMTWRRSMAKIGSQ